MGLRRVICGKGLTNRLCHSQVRNCIFKGGVDSSDHYEIPTVALVQGEPETHPASLTNIHTTAISCIFTAASNPMSDHLRPFAEKAGIPLLMSAHDIFLLESRLMGLVREKIHQHILVHGVLLKMFGRGVLIQGESGSGKTAAGLMLARRGHVWIADDAIQIRKRQRKGLYAGGCKPTRDLIDLKRFGIQEARRLLAGCRMARGTTLHLILEMEYRDAEMGRRVSKSNQDVREIMGSQIPCIRIPSMRDDDFDLKIIEESVKAFAAGGGTS